VRLSLEGQFNYLWQVSKLWSERSDAEGELEDLLSRVEALRFRQKLSNIFPVVRIRMDPYYITLDPDPDQP